MSLPDYVKPGDFGLTQISGNVGKAIRFGQWLNGDGYADFEHAFIYIGDSADFRPMIVEAEPGGARIAELRYSNVLWSSHCPHPIKLTDPERTAVVNAAKGYVGVPYSAADYFAIAAVRFHLKFTGSVLKNYVASSKHMICSQLVDQCELDAGVHLFNDGRWPGYVSPGSLFKLLTFGNK